MAASPRRMPLKHLSRPLDPSPLRRAGITRYGKGRHPAALNLGDLVAYALAKVTGEPLLFKGNDFARTDLVPAYTQISDVQSPPG
jgi:hypothetical protein